MSSFGLPVSSSPTSATCCRKFTHCVFVHCRSLGRRRETQKRTGVLEGECWLCVVHLTISGSWRMCGSCFCKSAREMTLPAGNLWISSLPSRIWLTISFSIFNNVSNGIYWSCNQARKINGELSSAGEVISYSLTFLELVLTITMMPYIYAMLTIHVELSWLIINTKVTFPLCLYQYWIFLAFTGNLALGSQELQSMQVIRHSFLLVWE